MEAETRATWPLEPPEAGVNQEGSSPRASGGGTGDTALLTP